MQRSRWTYNTVKSIKMKLRKREAVILQNKTFPHSTNKRYQTHVAQICAAHIPPTAPTTQITLRSPLPCAAAGVRVPLPEHRQRQTFTQPGPNSHQAGHGADGVHVLRPVPRHDQVSDLLCQRYPQRSAGVFQEDRWEGTGSGNHVNSDWQCPLVLQHRTFCWVFGERQWISYSGRFHTQISLLKTLFNFPQFLLSKNNLCFFCQLCVNIPDEVMSWDDQQVVAEVNLYGLL